MESKNTWYPIAERMFGIILNEINGIEDELIPILGESLYYASSIDRRDTYTKDELVCNAENIKDSVDPVVIDELNDPLNVQKLSHYLTAMIAVIKTRDFYKNVHD